jgi:isocitrate/isopropylmalate dehydrogenase
MFICVRVLELGQGLKRNAIAFLSLFGVLQSYDFGGIAIDRHSNPLPDETLDAAKGADAILLGRSQWVRSPLCDHSLPDASKKGICFF